jgi:hypothetical protein
MKRKMIGRWGVVDFRLAAILVCMCAFALTGLAPYTFGQTIDGNIVGNVFDATGAVVPDANVTAINIATGVIRQATTSANGTYRFNNLLVGTYNITVKKSGFTDARLENLAVELNKTTTANVVVQLGTVTTQVEVVEAPPSVDTTTVQIQSTFKSDQIASLPIIENSVSFFGAYNLALLGAGVASNGGVGQGQGPSIGGQRPMNNNYMIEGVDNNSKAVTGPLVYLPTEATAEFSLLQNQFTAEFGHSSGGQFNTVVKSGSNQFHGSVYEYFQNRKLNAEDQSFIRQGFTYNPRFDQNKLGASIGGPVKKNKLFFFGNFEYAPLGQAYTGVAAESPTAAGYALLDAQAANASGFPNFSKTNYNIMKQYMAASTLPLGPCTTSGNCSTVNGVDIPLGTLPVAGAFFTNLWTAVASSDYNISDKDQLRVRFIDNKETGLDNNGQLPTFWTTLPQRFYLVTLAEYHTFSPNVTNELRVGYNRYSQYYTVGDFKFPGLDVFPNLSLDDLGVQIGPDGSAPQFTVQNTYQLVENLSWTRGKHAFKFGFDGRRSISPQHFIQRERGDYDYSTLEGYINDQIPDSLAERNLGGGKINYYGNQWATYLYGQDSYRIRPNLTIDLGLRWERTSVPLSMGTFQVLNHIADVPGVLVFNAPKTSNKNFAPKVGIAYSPGTSGHTSIRAGFGLAYDVIFDNVGSTAYPPQISSAIDAGDHPTIYKVPFLAGGGIFPGSIATGAGLTAAQARAATSSYIPDQVLPYSINWNAGVEHVFHHDYTVELRYVGTRGVHLLVQNQLDRVSRVTPTRFLPTFLQKPSQATVDALPLTLTNLRSTSNNPVLGPLGFGSKVTWWAPIGDSNYHGLALQVTRRFARGFQLIGAYTWSHAIDDATATHFSTVLTPRREQDFANVGLDKSSSALDRRQRLTLSWVYDTPWFAHSDSWLVKNGIGNWTFAGTYTAESPEYVDVQSGVDSNLNGDTAGDRTIFNSAGVPGTGSSVSALCRTGAPVLPCTVAPDPNTGVILDAGYIVGYSAKNANAQYIKAQLGALATDGRNTLKTVGVNNFDMSLAKKFIIREGKTLEIRAETNNTFNHPQFTPGLISSIYYTTYNTGVRDYLIPGNARFGKWDQVFNSHARMTQLALRFVF